MGTARYDTIAPGGARRVQYLRAVIKDALEEGKRYNVPPPVTKALNQALAHDTETVESVEALQVCIRKAAHSIRCAKVAFILASDLEDALAWDTDPAKCGHPFRIMTVEGEWVCRHCNTDLSDEEEMGK